MKELVSNIIENIDSILVAVITTAGTVVTALITVLLPLLIRQNENTTRSNDQSFPVDYGISNKYDLAILISKTIGSFWLFTIVIFAFSSLLSNKAINILPIIPVWMKVVLAVTFYRLPFYIRKSRY